MPCNCTETTPWNCTVSRRTHQRTTRQATVASAPAIIGLRACGCASFAPPPRRRDHAGSDTVVGVCKPRATDVRSRVPSPLHGRASSPSMGYLVPCSRNFNWIGFILENSLEAFLPNDFLVMTDSFKTATCAKKLEPKLFKEKLKPYQRALSSI